MCKWYCTSNGPSTNLECLHCGVHYCGACLHGDAGKMRSVIRCAACGKKPRHKSAKSRVGWSAAELDYIHDRDPGRLGAANNSFASQFAEADSQATWKGMLRPEGGHADDSFRTYTGKKTGGQRAQPMPQQQSRGRAHPRPAPRQKTSRRASFTMAVLPRGWATAVDGSTGKKYYYHAETRETSWEHPGKMEIALPTRRQQQEQQQQQQQQQSHEQFQRQAAAHQQQETRRLLQEEERLRQYQRAQRRTTAQARSARPRGGGGGGGNIFDRLTDSSQYTGAHKHRFDAQGRGRGQAGRDKVAKGRGTHY